MAPKFMLEAVVLLVAAQGFLGAVGFFARNWPWAGLPLLPVFIWMVVRVALVYRDELKRAQKKGADLEPVRLSLFLALLWQLPALAAVPFWAPAWATGVWQGTLLSVPALFGWEPGGWLWWAALPEAALFVWMAARPEPKLDERSLAPDVRKKASEEWAAARRVEDVLARKDAQKPAEPKE